MLIAWRRNKIKKIKISVFSCLTKFNLLAHVENFLSQNCNIFSVSSIFKYIIQAKQITNLSLLLGNYLSSDISYRRVQKESDELLYTVCGHSLWSAIRG